MTDMCYNKILESVRAGNQCMIFVHSRKDTSNTAQSLIDLANELVGMIKFNFRYLSDLSIFLSIETL
jgi:replicative superfamily II helicase